MIYTLYLRLRIRRAMNMLSGSPLFGRFRSAGRKGTAPKRSSNPYLMGALALMMLAGGFSISFNALGAVKGDRQTSALLLVDFLAALLMTVGTREFAATEWDMEWLITLPLSKAQLLAMRLFERTFFNPVMIFMLFPLLSEIWILRSKTSLLAGLTLGYLTALPLFFLGAVLQTVIDTGLRVRMKPSQLRNLQAMFSVLSIVTFYSVMPAAAKKAAPAGVQLAENYFSTALDWGPIADAVQLSSHRDWQALLTLPLSAAAAGMCGFMLLQWFLRGGVAAGSGQKSVRASVPEATRAPAVEGGASLSPMPWKELKLLSRDRNYMVQTLLTPILILGMQIYLRISSGGNFPTSLHLLAATAFGMASYALLFSAFQILTSEGQALWILYTFPFRLQDLMVQKAKPWLFVALTYWAAFAAYAFYVYPEFNAAYAASFATSLLGIGVFLVLAVSLGVFSFDPNAMETGRKMRVSYVYLYMLLASSYGAVFFVDDLWKGAVGVLLVTFVAAAFWQKANDHLPYLLDASAAPPAQVTLADGMIAVYAFFVLQILFSLMLNAFYAFTLAGFVVFAVTQFFFRRNKTAGLPTYRVAKLVEPLIFGIGAGLLCAVIANGFLKIADAMAWFPDAGSEKILQVEAGDRLIYSLLALISAPIFEEFIFRGLIFQGLRKSYSTVFAVLISAVLFAIVHPMSSAVPVFVVGVAAALLANRYRSLFAPVAAHFTYNFCMVFIVWAV
jgi:membrane protease YdiL (CAAX protease family)